MPEHIVYGNKPSLREYLQINLDYHTKENARDSNPDHKAITKSLKEQTERFIAEYTALEEKAKKWDELSGRFGALGLELTLASIEELYQKAHSWDKIGSINAGTPDKSMTSSAGEELTISKGTPGKLTIEQKQWCLNFAHQFVKDFTTKDDGIKFAQVVESFLIAER